MVVGCSNLPSSYTQIVTWCGLAILQVIIISLEIVDDFMMAEVVQTDKTQVEEGG